jgi:hypothetical protein
MLQSFWGSAQARDEPKRGFERLAIARACCNHLGNPAGAAPVLLDVGWCVLGLEIPGDLTPMTDLVIAWDEGILRFPTS